MAKKVGGVWDSPSRSSEDRGAVMISDSDDPEQELQENLKLRRELVAEVAKSKGAANQPGRVGLPLGLFLDCWLLLIVLAIGLD